MGLPQISWHGEMERFVVSFKQNFKTFTLSGKLIHAADLKYTLLPVIACRPTGNWVVSASEKLKTSLLFFELNGLFRSEVDLDIKVRKKLTQSVYDNFLLQECPSTRCYPKV